MNISEKQLIDQFKESIKYLTSEQIKKVGIMVETLAIISEEQNTKSEKQQEGG